ncbi:cupin domain-containing protein [Gallaecimonas sp. GXIMD4217]|uniref:cupin domain-containing protein n=1 Tax=Gallaecimonas sp. GXIMD4217 TaxID=3131927 RepID=UPI00311AF0BD
MADPIPLTHIDQPVTDSAGNGDGFQYRYRRLGPELGLAKLGCSLYVVPPGKKAFPYHGHRAIEELFLILAGSGTLRYQGQERPVRAGDLIAAPLGKAHQLLNTSSEDLSYLAISNMAPLDLVLYPDSNKLLAYSELDDDAIRHISRLDDTRDYYDGEG